MSSVDGDGTSERFSIVRLVDEWRLFLAGRWAAFISFRHFLAGNELEFWIGDTEHYENWSLLLYAISI